jgi:UDP-N-acetylmuramate: L-alanyl-gamma-D-glutamyl-meso-diaminopimelate ligase
MKLHFSAICGTGMASLAGLMKACGHHVTGSDQDVYPPMSDQLAELGIAVRSPYDARNVPEDAERVVIGNALSRGNPEVEAVLDRKQPMTSMPALLAEEFLGSRAALVVAGTHGKTTTASLLAYLLQACGRDPSFLVGGIPADFGRSQRLGAGPHFVVEGDEYDSAFFDKRPKFVHYRPDIAVVGNVEFDHADIYPDLGAVQTAFRRLLAVIPRRGLLVAGTESPALSDLLPGAPCRVESFGLGPGFDWSAQAVSGGPEGSRFRLLRAGRDRGEFRTALAGEHNVRNALAALAAAAAVGLEPEEARPALGAFRGVRRRLELRGRVAGVALYDDFAHHPTAVRATLRALRSLDPPDAAGRLIAVFEPRSYTSRTRTFQDDFARALAAADLVIVAGAHLPAKVPEGQRLSEAELTAATSALGADARFIRQVEEIVEAVAREARSGDRVVILSNGGFGGIHERLLGALRNRTPGPPRSAVV